MEIQNTLPISREQIHKTLAVINCNDHTEKKGRFTYLSWTWAISILMKHFPNSHWEFLDDLIFSDGSMEVRCQLTIEGHTYYMWLAVMDNRNQAIQNPSSTHINKARMRCLTKAIAVAGLGFYIFEGEDLPNLEEDEKKQGSPLNAVSPKVAKKASSTTEEKTPLQSSVADAIIQIGGAKGKTYAQAFTSNQMLADAIKYWRSHAKDQVQKNHLHNLNKFQKVMALEVKGVAT